MSNFDPHTNFPDDGTTPDLILPQEQIDKMLNLEQENLTQTAQYDKPIETGSTTPSVGFKPIGKAAHIKEEKQAQQTADPEVNVDARIKEMEATLKALVEGKGVRLASATKKIPKLDYSKLTEKDVWDLNIPIEAITHDLPDTMLLDLKDPAYVGRWVSTNSQRLGSMKAMGFTFIQPEDFAHELVLAIKPNENGWYQYNDVVAMKITKEKYFGALRRNHIRAMAMVNPAAAQQIGKKMAEQEIASGKAIDLEGVSDPDLAGSRTRDYQKYTAEKKLEVYTPGI